MRVVDLYSLATSGDPVRPEASCAPCAIHITRPAKSADELTFPCAQPNPAPPAPCGPCRHCWTGRQRLAGAGLTWQ